MSAPQILPSVDTIEISWSQEPGCKGLLITQHDSLGNEPDTIFIPEPYVHAFMHAVRNVCIAQ